MTFQPYLHSEFYHAIYHHLIGNVLLKETESPLILGCSGLRAKGRRSRQSTYARAWVSS